MIQNPKIKNSHSYSRFCIHRGNLAQFNEQTSGDEYWEEYWDSNQVKNYIESGSKGDLDELEKYIPLADKNLPMVEGGCGPGRFVIALHNRGFDVTGIEYNKTIVEKMNQEYPQFKIRLGNVLSLDIPSGTVGTYFSLGVAEHFEEGPDVTIEEGRRILKKGGLMFFQVPYLNPLRKKFQAQLVRDSSAADPDFVFYQYFLNAEELKNKIKQKGFEVVAESYGSMMAFLNREHIYFSKFWRSKYCRNRMKKILMPLILNPPKFLAKRYGHTILFVCRAV